MFKSIMTAVAAAAIAVTGAPGVEASTGCSTLRNGYTICTIDNGNYGTDAIGVWTPSDRKVAHMKVICTGNGGNRWSANRNSAYVSYNDLQAVANWWCANY